MQRIPLPSTRRVRLFTTNPTATVNPDNMTGSLHAVATDPALNANPPTYTWSMVSGPAPIPPVPGFGSPTSATTVAITFTKAGTYVFQCVATDNFGSVSTPQTSPVTVIQILNSILVCPAGMTTCSPTTPITVQALQDQLFSANGFDQFKNPMNVVNPTWSVTGCPSCVSGAGDFRSSIIGQQFTIVASKTDPNSGKTIPGAALVNVISFDVSSNT